MALHCRGYSILPMLSEDQQIQLWVNAYNAALTGLLARNSWLPSQERQIKAGGYYNAVCEECKSFADVALSDALAHSSALSSTPPKD